jgi:integrase
VVDAEKLLTSNPWNQFTWIEGTKRPIRQFDGSELLSLLDHLETKWGGVPIAATAAKVFLWSGCRKLEIAGLLWDSLRLVGNECHFEIVGKWGVERWFRLPEAVYQELLGYRTQSPFVFDAYNEQLRHFRARKANLITGLGAEFSPDSFGDWFYNRVAEWSKASAKGHANVHVFRKTTLQHARRGEDINRQVAADARVSESVMMTNYVKESDEEMRQRSNRTCSRIIASLPAEVAQRYGHVRDARSELEDRLRAALDGRDWALASELAARLARHDQQAAG